MSKHHFHSTPNRSTNLSIRVIDATVHRHSTTSPERKRQTQIVHKRPKFLDTPKLQTYHRQDTIVNRTDQKKVTEKKVTEKGESSSKFIRDKTSRQNPEATNREMGPIQFNSIHSESPRVQDSKSPRAHIRRGDLHSILVIQRKWRRSQKRRVRRPVTVE